MAHQPPDRLFFIEVCAILRHNLQPGRRLSYSYVQIELRRIIAHSALSCDMTSSPKCNVGTSGCVLQGKHHLEQRRPAPRVPLRHHRLHHLLERRLLVLIRLQCSLLYLLQ